MKLKIGAKLLGGFIIVAFIGLIIGVVGFISVTDQGKSIYAVGEVRLPSILGLERMYVGILQTTTGERLIINRRLSDDIRKKQFDYCANGVERINAGRAIYEPIEKDEEETVLWQDFLILFDSWMKSHEELIEIAQQKEDLLTGGYGASDAIITQKDNEIMEIFLDCREHFLAMDDKIIALIDLNQTHADTAVTNAETQANRSKLISIIVMVIGFIGAVILGIVLSNNIRKPLLQGVSVAEAVASGDLSKKMTVKTGDELEDLATSLNQMTDKLKVFGDHIINISNGKLEKTIEFQFGEVGDALVEMNNKLREVVGRVIESADQVSSSSEELASTAQNLSENAQNQASIIEETSSAIEELGSSIEHVSSSSQEQTAAVEETSSTMEELANSIRSVADLAMNVQNGSKKSVEEADGAVASAHKAIEGMKEIQESSNQMAEIVAVIQDIADNTSLLSLNASIEAARAGDAGRGFAVVADSVSRLADRSAESAKEIEDLIKQSNSRVENGASIVEQVAIAIEQIRKSTLEAFEISNSIADSAHQQSTGSSEVVNAVERVNEMSQNISSATEEQSANAREMSSSMERASEVTQQVSSAAEELATSTEELSTQAVNLKEMVTYFSL